MITGTLMWDIQVEATNKEDLKRISAKIQQALKPIAGVLGYDEVDRDLIDDADDEGPQD